jgi:hypothetical protein
MRKKIMKENLSLPFQVENLINNLLDKKQSVYIRNNYRQTLSNIKEEVEKALRKFDNEYVAANNEEKKKRK